LNEHFIKAPFYVQTPDAYLEGKFLSPNGKSSSVYTGCEDCEAP
jgi:hypothetical protein